MKEMKSWTDQIGYTSSEKGAIIRALVYGEAGCGKTHFIGTFPNPFIIDADKGLLTLKDMKIPFVALERETKVFVLIRKILFAMRDKTEFFEEYDVRTLGIDSITALADMLLIESMMYPTEGAPRNPNKTKPIWDDYFAVQNRLKWIVKFCQDLGLNIVATCGQKVERDEQRGTFVGKPNMVGGYRDVISHDFDEVYYLSSKANKEETIYRAYTGRYLYFEAKSRLHLPHEIIDPSYAMYKLEE